MKSVHAVKWVSGVGVTILLLLAAGAAISAVDGLDMTAQTFSFTRTLKQLFEGWHGSGAIPVFAVLCLILAIAGRGIERH